MLNRRRFIGLATAAVAAPSLFISGASGADWPVKPVRVVVPFTPGGSTDITARLVSNRLQEVWGQSVGGEKKPGGGGRPPPPPPLARNGGEGFGGRGVGVENKPGAGGNIAADMVAHSDPD